MSTTDHNEQDPQPAGQPDQAKKSRKPRKSKGRGAGECSVFYREDRDQWIAQVTVEDSSGKKKKKQTYHDTQKEAIAARNKMLHELEQETLLTEKDVTVRRFLEDWFENVQRPPTVRVSTYAKQRTALVKHILPALGHISLRKLSPDHLNRFYTSKLNARLSAGYIRNMHFLLRKALDYAVRTKKVIQNVCGQVTPPRYSAPEQHVLTEEQARHLLDVAQGHRLEVVLILALVTGMRRGEILGLKWPDIDWEKGVLYVRRTVGRVEKHGMVLSEPKTAKGKRQITLPDFLIDLLELHRGHQLEARQQAGSAWQDQDIVFCSSVGTFMDPSHLRVRFLKLLRNAGLSHMRFHDLRHSMATILLARGVHPKVVQEILGHSDVSITLRVYGHVIPSMHEEAINKMGGILKKQTGEKERHDCQNGCH